MGVLNLNYPPPVPPPPKPPPAPKPPPEPEELAVAVNFAIPEFKLQIYLLVCIFLSLLNLKGNS